MERLPDSSLIIGVATSTAERVQLARLLGGADALLLVSSAEQARAFLDLTTSAGSTPVVLTPAVLPAAKRDTVTAHIVSAPLLTADPPTSEQAPTSSHAVDTPVPGLLGAGLPPDGSPKVPVEELSLDVERRVVRWKDREMPLTRLEHDFLHCLVEEPGRIWTYQRLHHAVWGNEFLGHGSHIHSVVKRLRQKLAELGAAVTIHAVRGVGFHLLPTT
jgi:hypothetical protein